jgi:peptide/nickel transport system substrate-binding protein
MWLELNTRRPPMGDVRVRRAIAHAIDKNFVVNSIWFGLGKAATGAMRSSHTDFYTADVPKYEYDVDKANRLLDEAGYRRGADGMRFKLTEDKIPYGDEYVRLAEYVKEQLKKLGIDVTIRNTDTPGWFNRAWTTWDFEFTSDFVGNLSDPSLGMPRFFLSSMIKQGVPFTNNTGYSNPEIDKLFPEAARELDLRKRQEIFRKIQQILATDLPTLPLLEIDFTTFYNNQLRDVIVGPFGNYDSFDRVSWRTAPK